MSTSRIPEAVGRIRPSARLPESLPSLVKRPQYFRRTLALRKARFFRDRQELNPLSALCTSPDALFHQETYLCDWAPSSRSSLEPPLHLSVSTTFAHGIGWVRKRVPPLKQTMSQVIVFVESSYEYPIM